MVTAWITTSSTHVEAIINSLTAACERSFIPDRLYILDNPDIPQQVDRAIILATTIITYGGNEPAIELTTLEDDTEFDRIHAYIKDAIEEVQASDGAVAVDITPGRKFMSAISFVARMQYGADHVYYFYLESGGYYGQCYPEMPRTASKLYDFTEEL